MNSNEFLGFRKINSSQKDDLIKTGSTMVDGVTKTIQNNVIYLADDDLNIENGEGQNSIRQKGLSDEKAPQATGLGAIAFGGFRGDKPNGTPDEEDRTTVAEGIQSVAFGAGNYAHGHWDFVAGKDNNTYQKNSTSFGGKNTAGDPNGDQNAYSFAFAIGEENTVTGRGSFGGGKQNTVTGDYTVVNGRENTVHSWYGIVTGFQNTIGDSGTANSIAAFGSQNKVNASSALVSGEYNTINAYGSNALGSCLKTTGNWQTVVGELNIANPDAQFIVGCGSDDIRKNGFLVMKDGRAKVLTAPREANDVVTFDWVNTKINSSNLKNGNGTNSLVQTSCDPAKVTGSASIAFGTNNTVIGGNSAAFGSNNTINNGNALVSGDYNIIGAYGSNAFGSYLKTNKYWQTVVGQLNNENSNAYFIVGNGSSSGRSNAFEVLRDGRAKVYGTPTEDNDVVRKVDLQNIGGGTKLYKHSIVVHTDIDPAGMGSSGPIQGEDWYFEAINDNPNPYNMSNTFGVSPVKGVCLDDPYYPLIPTGISTTGVGSMFLAGYDVGNSRFLSWAIGDYCITATVTAL